MLQINLKKNNYSETKNVLINNKEWLWWTGRGWDLWENSWRLVAWLLMS